MINVKDQVFNAIQGITENVSDQFPTEESKLPAILYTEEDNSVYEWCDDKESKAKLRYRVDIWDEVTTSILAMQVDAALSALGLKRTMCMDVPDPAQVKRKVMRYEGIIDVETERVYNNNL